MFPTLGSITLFSDMGVYYRIFPVLLLLCDKISDLVLLVYRVNIIVNSSNLPIQVLLQLQGDPKQQVNLGNKIRHHSY